ncbi:UNVERIFIED_CONTAM: hypothetical protein GTU68_031737 [Idotea baltica]|nr:hypothetical protein [Idotea baltica]
MKLIRQYFPQFSDEQIQQFQHFHDLIIEWNEKINLISRKNIDEVESQHLLHSLAIAKVMAFKGGTKVLDVGTGGGFPGIPLAIAFPNVSFTFVDSIQKKINAVRDMVIRLELKNVKVISGRAENVPGKFDFVTARAVARTDKLVGWTKKKFNKKPSGNELANGYLLLKGGDLTEELDEAYLPYVTHSIAKMYTDDFFETKYVVYLAK